MATVREVDAIVDNVYNDAQNALVLHGKTPPIIIHPRGDLKLQNGSITLLVSSDILTMTSTYFDLLLKKGSFLESQDQPDRNDPPIKVLNDDNPEAFTTMCRMLHFQDVESPANVEMLKALADVCDYYGCQKAVSPRAQPWAKNFCATNTSSDDDLLKLMFAARTFSLQRLFADASMGLASRLAESELKQLDVHPLPLLIKDDLLDLRHKLYRTAFIEIESIISSHGNDTCTHWFQSHVLCSNCLRSKPPATKKCGSCGCREMVEEECNLGRRSTLIFDWLRFTHMWPLTECEAKGQSFQHWTCSFQTFYHLCSGGDECSLSMTKQQRLADDIRRTTSQLQALQLEDYLE